MAENKFLLWMTKTTQTVYWNDSAVGEELDEALENGATGMTTNPFLVNAALENDAALRESVLRMVPDALRGAKRAEALTMAVVGARAELFAGFAGGADNRLGGVCAQVDPHFCTDACAMVEQAIRLRTIAPNICIKIPATRAGIVAYEECAALGMNVIATVSFSVAQAVAAGEAFGRGAARARKAGLQPGLGLAVVMGGRVGDYLRDVAKDQGVFIPEEDLLLAGTAVLKRAYAIFQECGFEAKVMPAAGRCPAHVADLAGADMVVTISPKIARMLGEMEGPFEERIQLPIPEDSLGRLRRLREFTRVYEPDGLAQDEFITFGALNRTVEQFAGLGWDRLTTLF